MIRDDYSFTESGANFVGALTVHVTQTKRGDQPLALEIAEVLVSGNVIACVVVPVGLQIDA